MATPLTNFLGQNWLITPAVPLVGDLNQPGTFFDQTWSLVLTGIVEAGLQGNGNETVSFIPSGLLYTSDFDSPPEGQGPLYWVLNQYGIQRPPLHTYTVCFSLQQWAPFVSLSSTAGSAVNLWRPTHFFTGVNFLTNEAVGEVFTGITADLAVRDTDASILNLSYNVTLLGKIVFAAQNSLGQ